MNSLATIDQTRAIICIEQVDARRAEFLKSVPADKAQSYQAGIDAVTTSGIYDRALKTGAKAPDLTLNNAEGQPTRLSDLLKKGPVVLTWYRGGWCPYCNLALAALTERGLFRRIQPAGSSARYESRVGDNHHHLVCRTCGRMVDVDCAVGDTPCLTAAADAGYEVDEAEVVYWGTCPACSAVRPS